MEADLPPWRFPAVFLYNRLFQGTGDSLGTKDKAGGCRETSPAAHLRLWQEAEQLGLQGSGKWQVLGRQRLI